ncbi:type I-E CRISPR-associated protein Cse2/CasB [Actinomadura hibisca]|uniref:type I-E CRISPR-associated protein Cse2/CasB n=1 Tax=Actinomadura hibisca TaxID=68565 RepID=UPI0008327DE3|nr:type I-E CRISPR-associated protein Cse2/CasB [Actinomadura hibisca]
MSTQASPSTSYDDARDFIARVHRLCEDPGKQAALRSGLRRPLDDCKRMHALIAPHVRTARNSNRERAYYAIAAMIAALPPQARGASAESQRRNFGVCLAQGVDRGTLRESAAEARINLLTRQSTEGVHRHLPSAALVLAQRPADVDWAQLLLDLRDWDDRRDRITRRWLQDFYRTRFKSEELADRPDDATPNEEN